MTHHPESDEHCRGEYNLGERTFYHFAPRMSVISAKAGIHRGKRFAPRPEAIYRIRYNALDSGLEEVA